MTLEIGLEEGQHIVIVDTEQVLAPKDRSQVRIYGYVHNEGSYRKSTTASELLFSIRELIEYFASQNISFHFQDSVRPLFEEIRDLEARLDDARRLGTSIKSGTYDVTDFENYNKRLSQMLRRPLLDHQKVASYHLYSLRKSANFSVPGSGKTAAVLSAYESFRAEGLVNTLFVAGPVSCFAPWKSEFNKTLGRKPKAETLVGGDRATRHEHYYADQKNSAELYLITFQTLLNDISHLKVLLSSAHIRPMIVIDEAHYIKRLDGAWASTALDLSGFSDYKCVLTGTPMPNKYSDIFNLFDFLWPNPPAIDETTKTRIISEESAPSSDDQTAVQGQFESSIGSLFFRVRKKDLGLTKPNFVDVPAIRMNENESTVYQALVGRLAHLAAEDYLKEQGVLEGLKRGRLMRLRQSVSYTGLLAKPLEGYDENLIGESLLLNIIRKYDDLETPAKAEALLGLIDKLSVNNQKVVVWSNFVGTIDYLERVILGRGYKCAKIYGAVPVEREGIVQAVTREKIRDQFCNQNSGLNILLANPAACAESISLHETCHNAIYYDLSYNCAQYLQSQDRIHRVGGSEKIVSNYYFLQYEDTIDSDIKNSLDEKAKKMSAVIDQDYSIANMDMLDEDDDVAAYDRIFRRSGK